ncbi:MAG: hypothetical protein AAGC60_08550 [Acidobacteriota bacterium]
MARSPASIAPPVHLALTFAAFFALAGAALLPLPVLTDTDSYYHLAVARLFADEGLVDQLDWARLSLLHDGFGDKEVLFHLLLMPFSGSGALGGHLALALGHALLSTLLVALGRRAVGAWGWTLPAIVYLGSIDFLGRAVRLRPEHGALLLILLAPWAVASGRARLVGVLAALYAWTHTAVHAFVGLCVLLALQRLLRDGAAREDSGPGGGPALATALFAVLGAGVGLLAHPHFPHNLLVWKVQSVDFFLFKDVLDVGTEIRPPTGRELLLGALPAWLAAAALVLARPDAGDGAPTRGTTSSATRRLADAYLFAFAVFGLLAVLMLRFVTFALPLGAVALAFALARRGGVGRRLRLGPLALPTALALALVLLPGVVRTVDFLGQLRAPVLESVADTDLAPGIDPETLGREHEWSLFGAAVPEGAAVAAEWGSTALYAYWAPQGRYLNVLDPVFMASVDRSAYAAQRRLFDGDEPDTAMVVAETLDSSHLALSSFHRAPRLLERLDADPRWRSVYRGWTRLEALRPAPAGTFVVDWTIAGRPYPLRAGPLGLLEAFVDGRRLEPQQRDARGCFVARHRQALSGPVELAASGPTAAWVDGAPIASFGIDSGAVLGRGLVVTLPATGSELTIRTCPDRQEVAGFFLRRLEVPSAGPTRPNDETG